MDDFHDDGLDTSDGLLSTRVLSPVPLGIRPGRPRGRPPGRKTVTPDPPARPRGRPPGRTRDPDVQATIYDGATLSELSAIFHKDRRTVTEKLRSCPATGTRQGYPVYDIAAAAAYLVDPLVDVEDYIKKLRPQDLPPLLLKEYWAGQIAKQKFELNAGKLWPTEDVMSVLADVFKKLKTGILLFADTVEAKSDLTERQRTLLNELADGLLVELHRTLIEGEIDQDAKLKRDEAADLLETV